eukprot:TRINITY_DN2795_c0_g1::TRINITY_DN2795_c0_g1_i1::g.27684::m.27684 TRINITY_DN2795_c0_g1::TRINITY_DN2795_c0_g1_i1::g.27684  ORF type:complete len:460 (-),score=71.30,Cyclin/PF08613.6/7.5e-11,Cyclin/PF08613.6/1.5e+04,Cyclin/PF08613.6/4.8e+03,Cyclin_N/PF00134.18/3e-06 TRINITY_DN2795_c0_g1_i1:5-1384(-)
MPNLRLYKSLVEDPTLCIVFARQYITQITQDSSMPTMNADQLVQTGFDNDPVEVPMTRWLQLLLQKTSTYELVTALIYLRRLAQTHHTGRILARNNQHRLLFTAVMIANKYLCDSPICVRSWCKAFHVWDPAQLLQFELSFLQLLNWRTHVTYEEYTDFVSRSNHYLRMTVLADIHLSSNTCTATSVNTQTEKATEAKCSNKHTPTLKKNISTETKKNLQKRSSRSVAPEQSEDVDHAHQSSPDTKRSQSSPSHTHSNFTPNNTSTLSNNTTTINPSSTRHTFIKTLSTKPVVAHRKSTLAVVKGLLQKKKYQVISWWHKQTPKRKNNPAFCTDCPCGSDSCCLFPCPIFTSSSSHNSNPEFSTSTLSIQFSFSSHNQPCYARTYAEIICDRLAPFVDVDSLLTIQEVNHVVTHLRSPATPLTNMNDIVSSSSISAINMITNLSPRDLRKEQNRIAAYC